MSKPKQNRTDRIITRITSVIAIVVLVGLAVWGIKTWQFSNGHEETNDAQVEEYINPVSVKVSGYIRKIYFDENKEVKKGDTLMVIDNSEYLAQKEEAEASVVNAKAQLSVLASNVNTQQKTASVSSAQVAAAKARLWKQEQDYERYKKLLAAEAVTMQQFENILSARDVAKAEYEAMQDAYNASLSKVDDIAMQQKAAVSEIRRKQAVLNLHEIQVGYTVITAPYNGKMGRLTVQEGQLVNAGQTIGFIVNYEAGKWVVANFKETQFEKMRIGQKVTVHADAYPGHPFEATLTSFSPATGSRFALLPPDNASGNFVKVVQRLPVKIEFNKSTDSLVNELRPGMNVAVDVHL